MAAFSQPKGAVVEGLRHIVVVISSDICNSDVAPVRVRAAPLPFFHLRTLKN